MKTKTSGLYDSIVCLMHWVMELRQCWFRQTNNVFLSQLDCVSIVQIIWWSTKHVP